MRSSPLHRLHGDGRDRTSSWWVGGASSSVSAVAVTPYGHGDDRDPGGASRSAPPCSVRFARAGWTARHVLPALSRSGAMLLVLASYWLAVLGPAARDYPPTRPASPTADPIASSRPRQLSARPPSMAAVGARGHRLGIAGRFAHGGLNGDVDDAGGLVGRRMGRPRSVPRSRGRATDYPRFSTVAAGSARGRSARGDPCALGLGRAACGQSRLGAVRRGQRRLPGRSDCSRAPLMVASATSVQTTVYQPLDGCGPQPGRWTRIDARLNAIDPPGDRFDERTRGEMDRGPHRSRDAFQ